MKRKLANKLLDSVMRKLVLMLGVHVSRGNKGDEMLDDVPRKSRREFNQTRGGGFGELEPTIITSDGEDKFVVMSLDNFVRMRAFRQGGEMCRIQGKIFREVQ